MMSFEAAIKSIDWESARRRLPQVTREPYWGEFYQEITKRVETNSGEREIYESDGNSGQI